MLHKVAQSFYHVGQLTKTIYNKHPQTKKLSSQGWALHNEVATTIYVLDFETSIPN
jgi:hypothetical protein